MSLTSIQQVDLRPKENKIYFNAEREWREEFIYFLMVDRFHDGRDRLPILQPGRTSGFEASDDFYGGTIHFGTKDDLIELVETAHHYKKNGSPCPVRIIMDVVINHSGYNWFYPGDVEYHYHNDDEFPLGGWRRNDRPVPTEFRTESHYYRRGNMRNYDTYSENQHGDMSGLRDFRNDDTLEGSDVINTLIRAYCYWIRETDIDGFRVDASYHQPGKILRFCILLIV